MVVLTCPYLDTTMVVLDLSMSLPGHHNGGVGLVLTWTPQWWCWTCPYLDTTLVVLDLSLSLPGHHNGGVGLVHTWTPHWWCWTCPCPYLDTTMVVLDLSIPGHHTGGVGLVLVLTWTPQWWCWTCPCPYLEFVGCLTSQPQARVSQGQICSDNGMCCHTEIEDADQTFHLTQSQHTDTGPTSPSPSAVPISPAAGRVTTGAPISKSPAGLNPEKSCHKWDSNRGSSTLEADTLSTRLTRCLTWRPQCWFWTFP